MQRRPAHQHATAGGRGGSTTRLGDPRERIEHLEEEDESRNQRAFREALAAQVDHQRRQHHPVLDRRGYQSRHGVRSVRDVRVGQQQVLGRLEQPFGMRDAGRHRPQLAGPAGRQRGRGEDGQAIARLRACGGPSCDVGRPVGAVVVHDDDRQRAVVVLREQRRDRLADELRFVACGDHGDDPRPRPRRVEAALRQRRVHRAIVLAAAPEAAAADGEVEPDRCRQASDAQRDQWIIPSVLNQTIASLSACSYGRAT